MAWRLPIATATRINQIPLVGTSATGRRTKFELGELVPYRTKVVDEIINLSIKEYLGTVSFNNTTDVSSALHDIGITIDPSITIYFPSLNDMIQRRHNIVHQADRDLTPGSGHHAIRSVSLRQVANWKTTLDNFAQEVIKKL